MTPAEAEQIVLSQWVTGWADETPFVFESEERPSSISVGETSWAKVSIVDLPSEQHTLGKVTERQFLRRAAVSILVYTPTNAGTQAALLLAQQARAVFEATTVSEVNFGTGSIDRLGPVPPEYVILVTVPFDYIERK